MTLHEKCISVSKAVTDMLLKSKSMKVALIATIWPDKNRTFCSMLSSKRLDVLEGQEFLPCQQLPHPTTVRQKPHFNVFHRIYFLLV